MIKKSGKYKSNRLPLAAGVRRRPRGYCFFKDNCKHKKYLCFYSGDSLLSMLCLVDCVCDGEQGKYIYAACTLKASQGNGYMSALLDYCKENFPHLCLIPANDELIAFYYERGFTVSSDISNLKFDENDDIKEYLFEGCSLDKPFVMKYIGG
ncbi:MAG: GNAT family N-acetyltransferase [Clostridiales bacterium]|nr:GNAT family N-acetyltransferase [Clostridiales bacterium]